MLVSCGLGLTLVVAACWGKVGRRERTREEAWPPSPLLNEIQIPGIKWPEMLVAEGESGVVGERRAGRKPWCAARQVQVRVAGEGCSPRWVSARLCQGQCTSVWVPRPGSAAWVSCPACRPVRGSWVSPSLLCEGGRVRPAAQRLYRVRKCGCREPGTNLPPGLE